MKGVKIVPQIVGSALATIAVWIIGSVYKVQVPAEVAVAIGTVVSVGVAIALPAELEASE